MSGSAFIQNPIETGQISVAKKQARLVGCPDDTSASIVKCLRTKSAEEIVDSMDAFAVSFADVSSKSVRYLQVFCTYF